MEIRYVFAILSHYTSMSLDLVKWVICERLNTSNRSTHNNKQTNKNVCRNFIVHSWFSLHGANSELHIVFVCLFVFALVFFFRLFALLCMGSLCIVFIIIAFAFRHICLNAKLQCRKSAALLVKQYQRIEIYNIFIK